MTSTGAATGLPVIDWSGEALLACPACRADLSGLEECVACGAKFGREDGLPRLFPASRAASYEVQYDPARWRNAQATLDRLLRYPVRHGPDSAMPFRADLALSDVVAALPSGSRVLEIGCGGGQLRQWIRDKGHLYIGIDVSRTRIQEWLQRYGGPDLLGDAHFLPFRSGRFDLIISTQVTEHLAAPLLAIQELYRVLKPGAVYSGCGSFLEPWHDDSYFHLSPLGVIEMLQSGGFEIEALWPGWSGLEAIFQMNGPHMRAISPLAKLLKFYERAGSRLWRMARKASGAEANGLAFAHARTTGSINWIARKPQ